MKIFIVMIILVEILVSGCGNTKVERSEKSMGTVLILNAEGYDAVAAVDESFTKVLELEKNILDDIKKIEISAGNGNFIKINCEVFEILSIAQEFSRITEGEFDITVGAAMNLWKVARQNSQLPTDEEILQIQKLVGFQNLELRQSDCSARLKVAGTKITLGGVAKGYAVDICRKIFARHNIRNGLINFGTSTIYAVGEKNIGLRNPYTKNSINEIMTIKDAAISTSGYYENFSIVEGHRVHHIISPKTCMPIENNIVSVSVVIDGKIKNCATVADILSTAVFVIGKERTENLLSDTEFTSSIQIIIQVD